MAISKKVERIQGHYGLEFALANTQATVLGVIERLAKRNRVKKSERMVVISPKEKQQLELQLKERTRVRRCRENGRRVNCFK